jgi:4-hydroxybenzoate polyprenyltransferase
MFQDLRGFAQFISVERGLMLFMISVGTTFLMGQALVWPAALFLGVIVFCIWSAVDAMNNICDMDLDVLSDPARAKFTKKLGKFGFFIAVAFTALSLMLGAVTLMPFVLLFVGMGIFFGGIYSVPPFRLRKTTYKPIINFTVGAVPVMIIAAFFNSFSINIIILVLLIGVTTAVNSLWEDLADFASDFQSGSKTIPIILGFRRGLFLTVILGYVMIPLMVLVGVLFQLSLIYYGTLVTLASFITLRLIQKRQTLFKKDKADTQKLFKLGKVLAKDFVIVAIVFTLSLMLSSLLKINPIF